MSYKEYTYKSELTFEEIKSEINELNEYGRKAYEIMGNSNNLKYFFSKEKSNANWSLKNVYDELPKLQRDLMVNENLCSKMWIEENKDGLFLELEMHPLATEIYSKFSTKVTLYKRKCTKPIDVKTIISLFNLDYFKALVSYELAYDLRMSLNNGIPSFQMGLRELTAKEEKEKAGTQITMYADESNISREEWGKIKTKYIEGFVKTEKALEYKSEQYRNDWQKTWFNVEEDTETRPDIEELEKNWWLNKSQ